VNSPLPHGLWDVLAAPFDYDLNVDLASLSKEVVAFAADGYDGLVALGVFGEAASLRADEADAVADTVPADVSR
jgi:4-hydroxy-tetrahydrodipicolinate synthase